MPRPTPTVTAAHAITADEANRLAVSRFLNYQAGGLHFHTRLTTEQASVTVSGDVDFRRRIGYAQVTGAGSSFTLQWDATELLAWPAAGKPVSPEPVTPPTVLPGGRPARRALAPSTSSVDSLLAVLLSLGQDRPDNAQLIQQGGARWLRADTVGATPVDVIAGPRATGSKSGTSPLTYWITRTGQLLRVDATFGGAAPTAITLDTRGFRTFPQSGLLTS